MRNRFLKVIPNPYLYLDDVGNPCHVVAYDPDHNKNRGWVGATIADVEILDNFEAGSTVSPRQYTGYKFVTEPVSIPVTVHYREEIKAGSLIPTDLETAKFCGLEFKDPVRVLEEQKTLAAKRWKDSYGDYPHWYEEPKVNKSELKVKPADTV